MQDTPEHLVPVSIMMRGPTTQHLVHERAQTPPVGLHGVAFATYQLRSQIFYSPTKRVSLRISFHLNLGQPKISDPYMTLVVQKHVFRLQIPENDAILVQICQSLHHFGCVYLGPLIAEALLLPKICVKFSAIYEVHDKI